MSERDPSIRGPEELASTGSYDVAADKARAMLDNPRLANAFAHLRTGPGDGEEPFRKELEAEELRPAEPSERAAYAVAVLKPLHQQTLKMQTVCIDPAADPRRMVTQPSIATREPKSAPAPTNAPGRMSAPISTPRPAPPSNSAPRGRTGVASTPWSRRRAGVVACVLLLLGVAAAAAVLGAPRTQEPLPENEEPSVRVPATRSPQQGAAPAVTIAPVLPITIPPAPSSTEIGDSLSSTRRVKPQKSYAARGGARGASTCTRQVDRGGAFGWEIYFDARRSPTDVTGLGGCAANAASNDHRAGATFITCAADAERDPGAEHEEEPTNPWE